MKPRKEYVLLPWRCPEITAEILVKAIANWRDRGWADKDFEDALWDTINLKNAAEYEMSDPIKRYCKVIAESGDADAIEEVKAFLLEKLHRYIKKEITP